MEPLKIIVELNNSFISNDPWSPSIDGILGYWKLLEELGEEQFFLQASNSESLLTIGNLPIEKEIWGDLWWYQCSSPEYKTRAEFLRYYHRRFDQFEAEKYMQKQRGRVQTKAGAYKNFRAPRRTIVTPSVSWDVVGEKKEIEYLLKRCHGIGAKTGAGNGQVMQWTVSEIDNSDTARFRRPIPVDYAKENNIPDANIFHWGFRPAVRIPENQMLCAMP